MIPTDHITDIGSNMSEMKHIYNKVMNYAKDVSELFLNPLSDDYRFSTQQFTMDEILYIRSYGVEDFEENKKNTHSYVVYNRSRGFGLRINFMYISSKEKDEEYQKKFPFASSLSIDPKYFNPCVYGDQEILSCFIVITDDDLKEDNDRLTRMFLNYMTYLMIYCIERQYNINIKSGILKIGYSSGTYYKTASDLIINTQLYTRVLTMVVSLLFELTQSRHTFDFTEQDFNLYFFLYFHVLGFNEETLSKMINNILDVSCQNGFVDETDPAYDKICFIVQDYIFGPLPKPRKGEVVYAESKS